MLFLELLNINIDNQRIIYKSIGPTKGVIDKIILEDGFEIKISINIIIPLGRGNKITRHNFDDSLINYTDCQAIKDPFIFNLTHKGDLKTCTFKHFSAANKYSYSNITNDDFLKKLIKIKRDFFRSIELEDLLGKSNNHCLAVNLLEKKRKESYSKVKY